MLELAAPIVSCQQGRQCDGTMARPNHANKIRIFTQPMTTPKIIKGMFIITKAHPVFSHTLLTLRELELHTTQQKTGHLRNILLSQSISMVPTIKPNTIKADTYQ